MKNQVVADILYEIADLLDIKGEIFFKTRAYRMAAQTIEVLDEDIELVVNENRVNKIPGIGQAISKKVEEIVKTGKLEYLEKLKKEIPEGLLKMLDISSLGPKKVSAIYRNLGITTISQLEKAAKNGKLRDLDGFGEITEVNIIRGIQLLQKSSGRVLLNVAFENGNRYIDYLKRCKNIIRLSLAGSLRRMKETIGDLDILASSDNADAVMDFFVDFDDVQQVLLKGSTKTSVLLKDDVQVDLRVVKDDSYGAALQYFTGSKEHNVKMRSIAIKKGYKLNEYGLFDKDSEKFIVGKNEHEIYKKLDLDYIEPEIRENRGEIEIASKGKLPNLINYNDIKGDLHVHSIYSDGTEPIETIADNAKKFGYEYIGITDHSQSLKVARGLTESRVEKKIKEIDKINKKFSDFRVFCGTECDIMPDGSLDYSNKILKKFDYVSVAIHTKFKMSKKEATQRIISGIQNENVLFLAHPTCRILRKREPFELDIDQIFDAANDNGTYLEINSYPDRLDLNDLHAKQAKEKGLSFIIGTDSHNTKTFPYMKFGIATARRGWIEKKEILNTLPLKDLSLIHI